MKPNYEELEQRLIESERYGRQTDITIDNLEMKLAQMTAESAGLKVATIFLADEASQVYKRWNLIQQPDGDIVDMQTIHEAVCACHETPATDAFLAEVRAQGVEMFADDLLCPDLDSTIREFASQLRKGVQS